MNGQFLIASPSMRLRKRLWWQPGKGLLHDSVENRACCRDADFSTSLWSHGTQLFPGYAGRIADICVFQETNHGASEKVPVP